MRIEHIAMYVNDLEGARNFFVKYFGAVSNEGYHNKNTDFRSYFLTFSDGARLEIMHKPVMQDPEKTQNRTGFIHLAFSVGSKETVDSLTAQLKADGYKVLSGPRTTGDGYYESCILGFEGNQIEITVSGASMYLTYRNIVIRNAVSQDADLLTKWWNDGAVMAHAGFPNGLGTTPEKVAADLATDTDETRRRLILEYDSTPIGEMCYRNVGNQTADIGIKICEAQFQEKGIGRAALSMLIHHLFESGYAKIALDTDLENKRAQHVYERLGFQKLRINENSWKNQLGQWRSSVDYELTAEHFQNFAV